MNEFQAWAEARGLPWDPDTLSDSYTAVPGKAVVWLYTTNSRVMYVDNLLANPEVPVTRETLSELVRGVLQFAEDEGVSYVVATPSSAFLASFLTRFGFARNGHSMVKRCPSLPQSQPQ